MSDRPVTLLRLDRLAFGYPARPSFLGPMSLALTGGECWGIVGPNGAGKSTLLRLMAGLRAPSSGCVELDGRELRTMESRERARRIAFVPQGPQSDFSLPVSDVVLMGRFPHRRFGLFEDAHDRRIANEMMARTHTAELADRALGSLSGGEAQRVHLAAAIAQEPSVLLLDEPTASLDLQHQLAIFELVRSLADREGKLVVVVTHDLNLAARFCTNVLLLDDGRPAATGSPDQVLQPEVLEPVYSVRLNHASTASGERILVPQSKSDFTGSRGR